MAGHKFGKEVTSTGEVGAKLVGGLSEFVFELQDVHFVALVGRARSVVAERSSESFTLLTGANPFIHLGSLELPQPPDAMRS